MITIASETPRTRPESGAPATDLLDPETPSRNVLGFAQVVVRAFGIAMSLFAIYLALFGALDAMRQRSLLFLLTIPPALLLFPFRPAVRRSAAVPWGDWVLVAVGTGVFSYVFVNGMDISKRYPYITDLTDIQMVIGIVGVLLVVEVARRLLGTGMFYLLLVLFAYLLAGPYLPGVFSHPGFSAMWTLDHLFFTNQGVFGSPAGIVTTYVAIFVVFGSVLEAAGAGKFFINLSLALVGRVRGGPAKVAVFASGFFGSISGSPTANVLTTGVVTIPMMRKLGYNGAFAGAVEAAASTGGQILPPVMGAVAFLVAEYAEKSYAEVMVAAAIPAVLYYISLVLMIDFEAARLKLVGLPKDEVPSFWDTLRRGAAFLIPPLVIVYFLLQGSSPLRAGIWAVGSTWAVTWLRRETWMSARRIVAALADAGRSIIIPAVAVAAAGLIIGIISLTGIDMHITSVIIKWSGGSLLLALILTMFTCIILGMGMPPVAAYLIQVAFTVPALVKLGAPLFAAHMFVFYFLVFSFVTPPVAIAAYTAAGLTGESPSETGFVAWKLSLAAFLVPFAFIYGPGLLFQGGTLLIVRNTFTALMGVAALAAGTSGWLFKSAKLWERVLLVGGAMALISPEEFSDVIGLLVVVLVAWRQWHEVRSQRVRHTP